MKIPYLLFEKITNKFSEDSIIGRGGFGDVYKGVLYNKELVAVKLLHPLQALDGKLFNNEVGNLFTVDHTNIVGLIGYCDEIISKYVEHNGEKVWCKHICRVLCFEYFPEGSLEKKLYEQSFAPHWSTRYSIIKGICEGLNFLHSRKPHIFHLDLKPANILLDIFMIPKLADFGLSRIFSELRTHVTQQRIGTDKYMPPEYRNGGNISEKSDIFSLGVVMIDIMEGPDGYSLFHENGEKQFKKEVLAKWSNMIEPTIKYRPRILLQVTACIDIAMSCVDSKRNKRPTITTILATLNETETHIPSKQPTVLPQGPTIDLKNSLAKTVKMFKAELDYLTNSVPNMEKVPSIRLTPPNMQDSLITKRIENRETSSNVDERFIIGRTKEKKEILSILSENCRDDLVILPIHGIGGIGKTTLARLVYNDTQFSGYSRAWVYVSERFNLKRIGNSIISLLTNEISDVANMEMLNNRLGILLSGKGILIVLDDIWEKDLCELDKLKAMLRLGNGRKVIVVTTRDEEIATFICSTTKNVPYKLKILTDDMCWSIIKRKSDFENQADKNILELIGRGIAIKCGGVPLAAQSIGYLLRSMRTYDQWESVKNSDIWNSSNSEAASLQTDKVLASLWLSYSHMHRWLQSCFSYCAIFPKGHIIMKYDLIHQWIALEFTEHSKIFDSMQLCEQYITHLLGLSFLQHTVEPSDECEDEYTMHDLVHDLATSTNKVNINGNVVGSNYQYAFVTDPSMRLSSPGNIKALHLECDDEIELPDSIFSLAKNLLVLEISECINEKLPKSIGKLKQLRYLCAQGITDRGIPKFINKLPKLNYLNLSSSYMKAFPNSIGDMKGLMHLDLSDCVELSELPLSFGDLKQLLFLDLSGCSVPISESWGGFTKLQYLNLARLPYLSQAFEVLPQVIGKLTNLQYLNLSFFTSFDQINVLPEVFSKLIKLRYLNLAGCMKKMSESDIQGLLVVIVTLCNLTYLDLSESRQLNFIPESIGDLTKLHTLDLSGCSIQKLPACMAKMASLRLVNMTTLDECSCNLFAATNPKKLKIRKLEDVKSLEEAQSIKLSEKLSMNYLELEWTVGCQNCSMDDKDVLEKLVPPRTIKILNISGYMSLSFPTNWLMGIGQYLPNVHSITLENFPMCNNLPPLGQLPNLQFLSLDHLGSLEDLNTADSCGELMFPKLFSLDIISCPKLRIQCVPRALSKLYIEGSDNVLRSGGRSVSQTSASFSSSLLTHMVVKGSTVPLYQWSFLQHVSTLHRLIVRDCNDLTSCSPDVTQYLSSLRSFDIEDDILTELPTWLLELTSLQHLTITIPNLQKLNESTRQLTTELQSLILRGCGCMVSLPQWLGELTSLKELNIFGCEEIKYLPGSIRQLTELQSLCIDDNKMGYSIIRKLFSSISADTDEINIGTLVEQYEKEIAEGRPRPQAYVASCSSNPLGYSSYSEIRLLTPEVSDEEDIEEESTEEDIEEHKEEDIYESTDYEDSTEGEIEEHEEDVNNNVTSADAHGDPGVDTIVVPDQAANAHKGRARVCMHTWTLKSLLVWLVSSAPCLGKLAPCMGLESS